MRRGDYEAPVLCATDVEMESLVLLFEHQRVAGCANAEDMSPDLVRTVRLVCADIEERVVVTCPSGSVGDAFYLVSELFSCGEVLEPQLETLLARYVGRVGEQSVVRADIEDPERQVVMAESELVLVEQDLLVGPRTLIGRVLVG